MSTTSGVTFAGKPPAGVVANANAPSHATALIAVIGVFLPLAVFFTCLRTYTRLSIGHNHGLDDLIMLFATILSIVLCGLVLDMPRYGLGKHLWDVPLAPDLYPNFMLRNVVAAMVFCMASSLSKISILVLYIRIFPSRAFKYMVWFLIAFTIGYGLAGVFANLFSCNPINGSWDLAAATTAHCMNRPAWYFTQAGLGIFVDFATLIAPLYSLWHLQMPLRQKMGVAVVLTIGGFVCVVSIIRLQSLYALLNSTDLTKATVLALMWCVLELNLSIIGGNLPATRPFLKRHFPSLLGGTTGTYSYPQESGGMGYMSRRSNKGSGLRSGDFPDSQGHALAIYDARVPDNELGRKAGPKVFSDSRVDKGDNESEELIIQKDGSSRSRRNDVHVTVEYEVEYGDSQEQQVPHAV